MLSFSVFVGEDKTSHDLVSEEEYLGHSLGSKHCLFAKILPTVAQRSYMENIHPSICSSKSSLYKHTQSWKLWERKVIILRLGQGLKHFCPIQYKKRGGSLLGWLPSLPPWASSHWSLLQLHVIFQWPPTTALAPLFWLSYCYLIQQSHFQKSFPTKELENLK